MTGPLRDRSMAPVPDLPLRGEKGRWTCDSCHHEDQWGDGWMWLGVMERGYGYQTTGPHIEKVLCPRCSSKYVNESEVLDA